MATTERSPVESPRHARLSDDVRRDLELLGVQFVQQDRCYCPLCGTPHIDWLTLKSVTAEPPAPPELPPALVARAGQVAQPLRVQHCQHCGTRWADDLHREDTFARGLPETGVGHYPLDDLRRIVLGTLQVILTAGPEERREQADGASLQSGAVRDLNSLRDANADIRELLPPVVRDLFVAVLEQVGARYSEMRA